jgi:hypothetical protein
MNDWEQAQAWIRRVATPRFHRKPVPVKPAPVLSKYRRSKLRAQKHKEWLAEHNKPLPPPPPLRKGYKEKEQDKVQKTGYHRPEEKQLLLRQCEHDYVSQPQEEKLMTIQEALNLLKRMGET